MPEPKTQPVTPEVTLVRATPSPLATVASAARLCYAEDVQSAVRPRDEEDDAKMVRRIVEMGHLSTVEHVSMTFLLTGVSRAMTHQLVRHRLASYSQRSQRYVCEEGFSYIMPPQVKGKTVQKEDGTTVDAADYFAETMEILADRYGRLLDALGRSGESRNQDARYLLPNACETAILVTMNARELWHFFGERLCLRAQWEIRGVARKMFELAKDYCPVLFENVGPKCIMQKGCPEGSKSCGYYEKVKG